jgi:hypothetical protein
MCNHLTIIFDESGTSTCAECHLHFEKSFKEDNFNNYNGTKLNLTKKKSNIIVTLENKFGVNDSETATMTEKIFNIVVGNKMVKGTNKISILCASVYYAYYYLKKPVDFEELLLKFNITYKIGLKGLRLCQIALQETPIISTNQECCNVYSFTSTHSEKLKELMRKYDIPLKYYDEIEKIIITYHLKKHKILNDRVNNLWISSIFFWLSKINPYLEPEDFISINEDNISLKKLRSDVTFLKKNI